MVRAGSGKKQLKRCTLESEVQFGGWRKSAETNDPYIPEAG